MKKYFITFLILLTAITLPNSVLANIMLSPSQVVSGINQYRSANGLNALSTNSTLASLAQSHAQYQANIGSVTHTGPGGSTPKDRAYAAGYGNGNTIFMSEIIYGGGNATIDSALKWWKNSPLHNSVMLDSRYLEIGAGVATNGNGTYFTAELAWVTGYEKSGESESEVENENTGGIPAIPIAIATKNENGQIIHIVQSGQSLWSIAAVYKIDLDYLLQINNKDLNELIFVGDEIMVNLANTPTPSNTPTQLPTNIPSTLIPIIGNPISDFVELTPSPIPTNETDNIIETRNQNENTINLRFLLGIIFLFLAILLFTNLIRGKRIE